MPDIQSTPAPDDYALAEDFLSLDHWSEYGSVTADYRLAPEMSLGYGGSLYAPESGDTRLVRPTRLIPGSTYVFSWRAHPLVGADLAPALQLTNSSGSSFTRISPGEGMEPGWNHVISRVTISETWSSVRLRVVKHPTQGGPGYLHRIRATRVTDEGGAE